MNDLKNTNYANNGLNLKIMLPPKPLHIIEYLLN